MNPTNKSFILRLSGGFLCVPSTNRNVRSGSCTVDRRGLPNGPMTHKASYTHSMRFNALCCTNSISGLSTSQKRNLRRSLPPSTDNTSQLMPLCVDMALRDLRHAVHDRPSSKYWKNSPRRLPQCVQPPSASACLCRLQRNVTRAAETITTRCRWWCKEQTAVIRP